MEGTQTRRTPNIVKHALVGLVALATRVATELRPTTSPGIPVDHSTYMRGYEYVLTYKSYLSVVAIGFTIILPLPPKPAWADLGKLGLTSGL